LAREGQAHACRASRPACDRTNLARRNNLQVFYREPSLTVRMMIRKAFAGPLGTI
jgi:hypothetical protein